jgi:hypothetical protein
MLNAGAADIIEAGTRGGKVFGAMNALKNE